MSRADALAAPSTPRLTAEILAVLEAGGAGAPAVVARNADSAVISALQDNRDALRARRIRPQVLLASHVAPSVMATLAADFDVRVAPSDMQSLLREQVIFGGLTWFGDAVARGAPRIGGEGRFFTALAKSDWRGLRLVFDGLWSAAAPASPSAQVRANTSAYGGGYAGVGAGA